MSAVAEYASTREHSDAPVDTQSNAPSENYAPQFGGVGKAGIRQRPIQSRR